MEAGLCGRGPRPYGLHHDQLRLVPKSALLYDLQQLELELDTTDNQHLPMDLEVKGSADPSRLEAQELNVDSSADASLTDGQEPCTEAALWCSHPLPPVSYC